MQLKSIVLENIAVGDVLVGRMRWAAKPEYQIEIQTFRNVPNGKEGLTMLLDMVIQKDGRFFIIRAVPPEAVLKKQMQKKND